MKVKERRKLAKVGVDLFDWAGRPRVIARPDDPMLQAILLWRVCMGIHRLKLSYNLGGGHVGYFRDLVRSLVLHGLDCSGSVGLACHIANVRGFEHENPMVSGAFERELEAGVGRYVTVNASGEHIWLKFNIRAMFGWRSILLHPYRFDTSPWGSAEGPGPRMRKLWRSSIGFVKRHPKGL